MLFYFFFLRNFVRICMKRKFNQTSLLMRRMQRRWPKLLFFGLFITKIATDQTNQDPPTHMYYNSVIQTKMRWLLTFVWVTSSCIHTLLSMLFRSISRKKKIENLNLYVIEWNNSRNNYEKNYANKFNCSSCLHKKFL